MFENAALSSIASPGGLVGGPFGSSLVQKDYTMSGVPVIRGTNLSLGRKVAGEFAFVSETKFKSDLARNNAVPGDIVFTQRGTLGQVCLVPNVYPQYVVSQSQMRLRVDKSVADPLFIYYACLDGDFQRQLFDSAISTGVPHINLGILSRLKVPLPGLHRQRAIAEVLGALDDKIAANAKLSALLLEHLTAVVMVAAADDLENVPLGDVAVFHNRLRVPLSSREREVRRGPVPYYGAAGQLDTVDTHLFDMPLALVGEDGSVVNDKGGPVTQYIWGPAWVNNHAHVLTGTAVSTELLFVLLQGCKVQDLVTGAVQPKLSMGSLKRLSLRVPSPERRPAVEATASSHMALRRSLAEENATLVATRDALLPQLMSGKLRVKEAEKKVEALV